MPTQKTKSGSQTATRKPRKNAALSDWQTLRDSAQTAKRRITALKSIGWDICATKADFRSVIAILKDTSQSGALRLAALAAIQASSFDATRFSAFRADYLSALRSRSADPDMEIRQRALGMLAREHDAQTQRLLIDGLADPAKATLPPEKALQLLSYDVHSDAYEVARTIASNPPNSLARREALRVLAADASSAPMFESILKDKSESNELRQLSASALQMLAPERLHACARDIAVDESDVAFMRTVGLTALANFGDSGKLDNDPALYDSVHALSARDSIGDAASEKLRETALRYVTRQTNR